MNKVKISLFIIIISLIGGGGTAQASSLQDENLYPLLTDKLVPFEKGKNKYPEIKVNQLTRTLELTDAELVVVEQVTDLIDNSSFEDVISIFSSSLFGDVPVRDAFEGQKYELTDLGDVYLTDIKRNSSDYAKLIVSTNEVEKFDSDTIKKQLILLSYLIRWGSFSDGNRMFWKELYDTESTFSSKEQIKIINTHFIELFSKDPKKNLVSKNVNATFEAVFKENGQKYSYKQAIEQFLTQAGIESYSNWFYEVFAGKTYKDHYKGTNYDVGIWNRSKTFSNFLPYLLNQKSTTNLMIGETRGEVVFLNSYAYNNDERNQLSPPLFNGEDDDPAEIVLRDAMKVITNILELYDRTIVSTDEMNIDQVLGQRAILDKGRRWLDPEDSLSYELYRVAGYTGSHGGSAAAAGAGQIEMQLYTLKRHPTIAHEFAHEMNSLFNANSEYYSTYINTAGRQPGSYLNTYVDGKVILKSDNSITNKSTEQMQTKKDLTEYAKNMEDMAYVLDGLIAAKVLELPIEEQVNYIKIAYVNGENGALNTEIEDPKNIQARDVTVEELKELNISTIEDLMDHDVAIMNPGDADKKLFGKGGQGYGTTLTYAAFFLPNGKPVNSTHRILNTLLAKDGWEAFKKFNVTYNASIKNNENSGLSDDELKGVASLEALRTTYEDDTLTYRQLMKERYSESMTKFKEKGLLDISYEEMMSELSSMELEDFYNYKQRMTKKYLNMTDEFSKTIFGYDESIYTSIGSYTELYEAIEKNAVATIKLTQDFKVEGKYSALELPEFKGRIDGNGFTISNSEQALFSKLNGAVVKNVVLKEFNATNTAEEFSGALANVSETARIMNVHIIDSKISSTRNGRIVSGGLIGKSTASSIQDSSVQESSIYGLYSGGLVGIADNTQLLNVYSTGEISKQPSGTSRIGGIIGNGYNKTMVKNSYSAMHITEGNGMLGSDYSGGNKAVTFENSISLADVKTKKRYKYYDYGVGTPWENNYEITENTGKSSTELSNLNITTISLEDLSQNFFMDQLTWGYESIWGMNKDVSIDALPYLKNDDPRNESEEDLSTLILKTDYKEVYVGETIDLQDVIEEVRDKEGKLVDTSEVEIIGFVDTSKVGDTVISYRYNTIEKKLTVTVKENQTKITVHDSLLYVGEEWEAEDNFDSATDKEGKVLPYSALTVDASKVDTSKAGSYEVTYSYEEVESKAIVTVKERETKINVHDSLLYVGEEWEAEDNFDSATDKEGKELSYNELTVDAGKVDTSKAGSYEASYSYEEVESKAIITVKEKGSHATGFVTITFEADRDPTLPVDPTDPTVPVDPIDPTNPNGGELMISYASNLRFGAQSKSDTKWNALADKVKDGEESEGNQPIREIIPMISTKDSRGSNRKGWSLTAKQDAEFKDAKGNSLIGAELTYSNMFYAEVTGAPFATVGSVVLNDQEQEIASADAVTGISNWSMGLGNLQGTKGNQTTDGITLSVGPSIAINTATYATTVTYELTADPAK